MEEFIKQFLDVGDGFSRGVGYGFGHGFGPGNGNGYGGVGYGDGAGDGAGNGAGDGGGDNYGPSADVGYGPGAGYGFNNGAGFGDGAGDGIKSFNDDKVYLIDDTQTIIKQIRGDVAKGYILQSDLTLTPTVVVKQHNKFAHGETLHQAYEALQEKLFDDSTEAERIEAFIKEFPHLDRDYRAKDLFRWHHILTGSCEQGRLAFCRDREINLDKDYFSVYEFINLTRDSYGGDVIKKLEETLNSENRNQK